MLKEAKTKTIGLDQFNQLSRNGLILDVRSPKEYEHGHVVDAVNLPLFSDEERAIVGELYVKKSREEAIRKGLAFVSPQMTRFIDQTFSFLKQKFSFLSENSDYAILQKKIPCLLYCWRGGMRSQSMAWLLSLYGFDCYLLKGGYKTYRKGLLELMNEKQFDFRIIGGYTGAGKSELLAALKSEGEQVIDLEGIAKHKGSVFGHIGIREPQATNEMFENQLFDQLWHLHPEHPIWIEGESQRIGNNLIPNILFDKFKESKMYFYEIPREDRIKRLMRDYGHCEPKELINAVQILKKRLGEERMKKAISFIEQGELEAAIDIVLNYYDKLYTKSLASFDSKEIIAMNFEKENIDKAVSMLKLKS